jgi:hypothetical protein
MQCEFPRGRCPVPPPAYVTSGCQCIRRRVRGSLQCRVVPTTGSNLANQFSADASRILLDTSAHLSEGEQHGGTEGECERPEIRP